jgi:hypothetical protein
MPPELWSDDQIDVAQRHAIYRKAAAEIERLQTAINGIIIAVDALSRTGDWKQLEDAMNEAEKARQP